MTHLLTIGASGARGAYGTSQALGRKQTKVREAQEFTRDLEPGRESGDLTVVAQQNSLSPYAPSFVRRVPKLPCLHNRGRARGCTHTRPFSAQSAGLETQGLPKVPAASIHLLVHRPSQGLPRGLSHPRHPVGERRWAISGGRTSPVSPWLRLQAQLPAQQDWLRVQGKMEGRAGRGGH